VLNYTAAVIKKIMPAGAAIIKNYLLNNIEYANLLFVPESGVNFKYNFPFLEMEQKPEAVVKLERAISISTEADIDEPK